MTGVASGLTAVAAQTSSSAEDHVRCPHNLHSLRGQAIPDTLSPVRRTTAGEAFAMRIHAVAFGYCGNEAIHHAGRVTAGVTTGAPSGSIAGVVLTSRLADAEWVQ